MREATNKWAEAKVTPKPELVTANWKALTTAKNGALIPFSRIRIPFFTILTRRRKLTKRCNLLETNMLNTISRDWHAHCLKGR
jgi:hypothetical protein